MKTATTLAVLTMTFVSATQAQAQFNRFVRDPLKVVRKTAKDPLKAVRGTTDAVAGKGTARRIAGPVLSARKPTTGSGLQVVTGPYIDANGNVYSGTGSTASSARRVGRANKQQISGRWYWVSNYRDIYGKPSNRATSAPAWYTEQQRRGSNPPAPELAINPHTGWVYNVQTGQNVARAQRHVTNQFDQYGRQVVWYRYGRLQQKATPQPWNNGGFNNGGFNNGGFNNGGFNNGSGNTNRNNLSTGEQIAVGVLGALLQASQNNR